MSDNQPIETNQTEPAVPVTPETTCECGAPQPEAETAPAQACVPEPAAPEAPAAAEPSEPVVPVAAEPTEPAAPEAVETPAPEPPAAAGPSEPEPPAAAEASEPEPAPAVIAEDDFGAMLKEYEQNRENRDIHRGSIVEGTIVKIKENDVQVDIGTRCEGHFPVEEIRDPEGNLLFAEGDRILVQVLSSTETDFSPLLSYKNARQKDVLRNLRKAHAEQTPVEGVITEVVKGGLKVDLQGIEAFLPASQIELGYVDNTARYIGRKERFLILKINPKGGRMVISRRSLLEIEREKAKKTIWETLTLDQVVTGKVTRITGYGVFVDIGGIEALAHISNLSWDKVKKPSEIVKVGQEIQAKVVELDREKERIGLGLKQMVDDPWLTVDQRYFVGQRVNGTVEKLETFGAFVKLEPGVTALIPISEMSWVKRIDHPSELLKVGDSVETLILRLDTQERKISLSLKQNQPSPFISFAQKYQPTDILEGEVTNVVGYGAFVKLDDGVEGLMHISEISWLPVRNIDEFAKKGDRITVKILSINMADEKISLTGKIGDAPENSTAETLGEIRDLKPPRDDRRGGRRPMRRDREEGSEEDRYILDTAPSASTKLGDLFPQHLLDKMKSKRSE